MKSKPDNGVDAAFLDIRGNLHLLQPKYIQTHPDNDHLREADFRLLSESYKIDRLWMWDEPGHGALRTRATTDLRSLSTLNFAFSHLVSRHCLDAFIGDIEERFRMMVNAKGHLAATIWFWREVVHSFFSLALDAVKRISSLEKLKRQIGS